MKSIKNIQIGIMGSMEDISIPDKLKNSAADLGIMVAQKNCKLLFGFEGDFESLSSIAARKALESGGTTIAFTWGERIKNLNSIATVAINTGQMRGGGREFPLILSCDVIICIGGGSGTLMEIAMAYQANIPIIVIDNTGGWSAELAGKYLDNRKKAKILSVSSSEEAVVLALEVCKK